jgi:phosphoribosylformylglycinamidine (FGAM) synthase-like amidotransferase family enzyme
MHATVVLFPGINADAEMVRTLRDVCGVTTNVVDARSWNSRNAHK